MKSGSRRAIYAALAANSGIAIAKFVAYSMTGAASMLAEAVHSVADTGNQALLLWGGAASQRAPTQERPFGHGRERYFWAFVVALVMFSLGGLFAVYEGVQKLLHPHALADPGVAIGVLVLGLGLEGFSLRTAIVEARAVKGQQGWWAFVRGTKNPELPVVLLEDLGAMFGLTFALIGVSAAAWTENSRFDAAASIVIGVLLILIAGILAIEMKSLLIGEAASESTQDEIRRIIESDPHVNRIIDLRTLHLGPDQLLVAAKLEFRDTATFAELATAINAVEAKVRSQVDIAHMIYIEPDVYRASRTSSGDA